MPTDREKKFDSVRLMRELRDRISQDIAGMTFDEEKAYYQRVINGAAPDPKQQPNATRELTG